MPISDSPNGAWFFRSLAAATKTARQRAIRRLGCLRNDICGYLRSVVEFPTCNFPKFDLPDDPADLSFEDIEDFAAETRRFWKLGDGPISDMVLLLENNGSIVVRQELGAATLDAFSEWDESERRPYIVLNADKQSAVRSRFDAAHELAHMLLHRHLPQNRVYSRETFPLLESQAHYFAGALLLPATTFSKEIPHPNLQSFNALKSRWLVAIGAMIRRAENLGIISADHAERLFAYRSQQGWSKREPMDDVLEPEQPRFLRRSFDLILSEGVATKGGIESHTALFADDIESIAGLERGFLGDEVQHFKFPVVLQEPRPDTQIDTYSMRLPFSENP